MSQLLSRYRPPNEAGQAQAISPQPAGWRYAGFQVFELEASPTWEEAHNRVNGPDYPRTT